MTPTSSYLYSEFPIIGVVFFGQKKYYAVENIEPYKLEDNRVPMWKVVDAEPVNKDELWQDGTFPVYNQPVLISNPTVLHDPSQYPDTVSCIKPYVVGEPVPQEPEPLTDEDWKFIFAQENSNQKEN